MNFNNLFIISHYVSKVLTRNWMFRLFFLFSFVYIPLILSRYLIDQFCISPWGPVTNASFIPYTATYLFTIFQVLPLFLYAITYFFKEREIDTINAIYYRPESNAEYTWGTCWGIMRVFLSTGIIILFIVMMLHVFATGAPFNVNIYLFYFLTLVLPSAIFALGFFLFVTMISHVRAIAFILIFVYIVITMFYVRDFRQGCFDPLGITLPNVFSEAAGHVGIRDYLMQRGCWFFLGLGFIQWVSIGFERIPNSYRRFKQIILLVIFLFISMILGISYFWSVQKVDSKRHLYSAIYQKYEAIPKVKLLSQNIDYRQQGQRMSVYCRLEIQNLYEENLEEIIIYLNPELEVFSVTCQGESIAYDREYQVIRLKQHILSNEIQNIEINYGGKLDESICYLDVPDEIINETKANCYITCRYGKRYAFLTNDYTLLIPEVLWYPVTTPPVNPNMPYEVHDNFSQYMLRVFNPEGKTVISQGERKMMKQDTVSFYNEHLLPGISLCIGEYESKKITVQDVTYELNVLKGHAFIFDYIECLDTVASSFILDRKYDTEQKFGRKYPYDRFTLVEVPLTFSSYYRIRRGGSEFVQPELLFLLERGIDWYDDLEAWNRKLNSAHAIRQNRVGIVGNVVKGILENIMLDNDNFVGYYSQYRPSLLFHRNPPYKPGSSRFVNNPYLVAPLFFNRIVAIESGHYFGMKTILEFVLRGQAEDKDFVEDRVKNEAIEYLTKKSLRDAMIDKKLEASVLYKILELKSQELISLAELRGVSCERLVSIISSYVNEHRFQTIDLIPLNEKFIQQCGIDWKEILPVWYLGNKVPSYIIKDFFIENLGEQNRSRWESPVHVRFSAFNSSAVDGFIKVQWPIVKQLGGNEEEVVERYYEIKAYTGIKVAFNLNYNPSKVYIDMNISGNIPREISCSGNYYVRAKDSTQYLLEIDECEFLLPSNEFVVDDEDDGFQIQQSPFKWGTKSNYVKIVEPWERNNYRDLGMTVTDKWTSYLNNNAYGNLVRSAFYRIAGKGKSCLVWKAKLTRSGKYEIYAHIPEQMWNVTSSIIPYKPTRRPPVNIQKYKIESGAMSEKVEIDVREQEGWVLLGLFDFTAGKCDVLLSDDGDPGQIIVGDAIKWVYKDSVR